MGFAPLAAARRPAEASAPGSSGRLFHCAGLSGAGGCFSGLGGCRPLDPFPVADFLQSSLCTVCIQRGSKRFHRKNYDGFTLALFQEILGF